MALRAFISTLSFLATTCPIGAKSDPVSRYHGCGSSKAIFVPLKGGDDGLWSLFDLRVGTPSQPIQVLISVLGRETLLITPEGCNETDSAVCAESRGNLYDSEKSRSFQDRTPLVTNRTPGPTGSNVFGLDSVGLANSSNYGPTLENQVVRGVAIKSIHQGMLGIGSALKYYTATEKALPSVLSTLRQQRLIPSLSWGYTAGAYYRESKSPGSLVFGGYDASKIHSAGVQIPFKTESARNLIVGVHSITINSTSTTATALSGDGILSVIDSDLPGIWLPNATCQIFERLLGLVWDEKSQLYLVSETLHSYLVSLNFTIDFTLGSQTTGGNSTTIRLPYAAFDLIANPPLVSNKTYYFPLMRAANASQYILGRTFLQEAYLIVDHEREQFQLSQRDFSHGSPTDLRAILTPSDKAKLNTPRTSSHAKPIIIGAAVGGRSVLVLFVAILYFTIRRRRRAQSILVEQATLPKPSMQLGDLDLSIESLRTAEPVEIEGLRSTGELDGLGILEIGGDVRHELDGNQADREIMAERMRALRIVRPIGGGAIARLGGKDEVIKSASQRRSSRSAPPPRVMTFASFMAQWRRINGSVRSRCQRPFPVLILLMVIYLGTSIAELIQTIAPGLCEKRTRQ